MRSMPSMPVLVAALVVAPLAHADDSEKDAEKVALAYLKAVSGAGDEAGRDLLLGGATMNAQLFNLENYELNGKDPLMHEFGDLGASTQMMRELDNAGHKALSSMMHGGGSGDDLEMTEVSQSDAAKLMAPTREKAARFLKTYPVMAFVARVGKEVYWHPKNPLRTVLARAGTHGHYTLDVHLWHILSKEGPRQSPRRWPLRVLRLRTDAIDTGWKVLPASDWNAE